MAKPAGDFAWLLAPIEHGRFFEIHWEKAPLHVVRPDAGYYDDVLTLGGLERLIASPDARYPAVQLSRGGAYFPPDVYSRNEQFGSVTFDGVTNLEKINTEYRAGATVVLPALQRTWAPLRALCASIESELDHVAHANAYLTPGNCAGFTPHYDTHEILVLQIAGRKHWQIYEPPIALPHRRQAFTPAGYRLPSKPLLEIELGAGDLLYLPRGYVHATTTSASHSAHVTIGIAVYTWLDLAGELLQSGMASERFRKALPAGFASRANLRPALKAELARVLDDLRQTADCEVLIDLLLNRIHAGGIADRGTFRADVSVIVGDTLLEAPAPDEYRIARKGDKVTVEYRERRFVLPATALPALEAMRKTPVFKAADLPDSLGIEATLTMLRLLQEKGFLAVPSG